MKKRIMAILMIIALMVPSMNAFAAEETVVEESVTYNAGVPALVQLPDGNWALFQDGVFMSTFTGLYQDPNCGWVLIANGFFCPTYNDLWNDPVIGWWKVVGGTIDFAYTGWYTSPTVGTWFVAGGMLDFSKGQGGNTTTTTTVTIGMKNAKKSAQSYISFMAFSRNGLIHQLEYEGYSKEEATYGADNCGANWYEQAGKCAQSYLSFMSMSRKELYNQLIYEGFTPDEATYGLAVVGY